MAVCFLFFFFFFFMRLCFEAVQLDPERENIIPANKVLVSHLQDKRIVDNKGEQEKKKLVNNPNQFNKDEIPSFQCNIYTTFSIKHMHIKYLDKYIFDSLISITSKYFQNKSYSHKLSYNKKLLLFYILWFFTPTLTDSYSLESEWQQVSSKTLLSILADFSNAVLRMVSVFPLISSLIKFLF